MPRAVDDPVVIGFLQDSAKRLISEKHWTQKEFSKQAKISTATTSDLLNSRRSSVDYGTVIKVGDLLGLKGFGAVESAANDWHERGGRVQAKTEPPSRKPQPLLKELEEWESTVQQVLSEKHYLTRDSLDSVGRIQFNDVDFSRPLKWTQVADLAHAFFAHPTQLPTKKQ